MEGDMTAYQLKIARVERTLRWLEDDVPQLAMRVKDLSAERQKLAKAFAANMIDSTRAELERLRAVALAAEELDTDLSPCEPAD
jgi:chromosome segregation ATPase